MLVGVAIWGWSTPASATDVCFIGGANAPSFAINGAAKGEGQSVLLTDDYNNQASSAMSGVPFSLYQRPARPAIRN